MMSYYPRPTLFEFLYLIALLIVVLIGAKLLRGGHREEEYLGWEKERLKRKKRSRREYCKAQKSKEG